MNIHYTTQFKKDYKRIKKQNKDLCQKRTYFSSAGVELGGTAVGCRKLFDVGHSRYPFALDISGFGNNPMPVFKLPKPNLR